MARALSKTKRFFSFKRKYLCIPYSVFLILFVIIPIFIILVYAFTGSTEDGTLYFSFDALASFFTSPTKVNILVVSLFVGMLNTIICLLIGYPVAYLLANSKVNKNKILVYTPQGPLSLDGSTLRDKNGNPVAVAPGDGYYVYLSCPTKLDLASAVLLRDDS